MSLRYCWYVFHRHKSLSTGQFCLCATLENAHLWEYNSLGLSDYKDIYWKRETMNLWYYSTILFTLVGKGLCLSKLTVFYENYGFIVCKL